VCGSLPPWNQFLLHVGVHMERLKMYDCLALTASAGGAAAAAPEGGAKSCMSAPTSTSTRWAMVTLQPCLTWHSRGRKELHAAAIRVINSCREAMYGGFGNQNIPTPTLGSHARPILFVISRLNTRRYSPDKGAGAASPTYLLANGGTDG
jgi:hypothetical protein